MSRVVVVLGYRVNSKEDLKELYGRVDVGIEVFKRENADFIIFSGGITSGHKSEASIMAKYAKNKVPNDKIILEEKSLDTIGNAFFTRKILEKLGVKPDEIYIVSSCYHMVRAEYIFKKVYGDIAKINSEYCFDVKNEKMANSEQSKLQQVKLFFKDVADGDLQKIGTKLLTEHKLYKNKIGILALLIMIMIFYFECRHNNYEITLAISLELPKILVHNS